MQRATSGVDAMRPRQSLTPVPALPKSSGASGLARPATPTPLTCQAPSAPVVTLAPSASMARAVASTSSDSSRPRMRVSPTEMAPSISARCDIDLSPGTRIRPLRPWVLREIRGCRSPDKGVAFCESGSFAPPNTPAIFLSPLVLTSPPPHGMGAANPNIKPISKD